jgi:hypothetical protein
MKYVTVTVYGREYLEANTSIVGETATGFVYLAF